MTAVEFCSFGSSSAPAEYNEPESIILAFCEVKPEGLEGSRWKHVGAQCWQCCGHQSVVRSSRGASGQGDGAAAVSQPAQNPERLLRFCLSFLGVVDGVKPPHFTEGEQELSHNSAEGKEVHSIQHATSSGSVHAITLKFPPAVCLLCVLHNQLFTKSSQTLFP